MLDLDRAFVLHRTPYRDTSAIVEFLTFHTGRVSAVARGVQSQKSAKRAALQIFTPLMMSVRGHSELQTLTHVEASKAAYLLTGDAVYSGLYLNELLMRLLAKGEAVPDLFMQYENTLQKLNNTSTREIALREFELCLLETLGFGIEFCLSNMQAFQPNEYYCYHLGDGFVRATQQTRGPIFSGSALIGLAEHEWQKPEVLTTAKRLCRVALQHPLAGRPIMSREFFL